MEERKDSSAEMTIIYSLALYLIDLIGQLFNLTSLFLRTAGFIIKVLDVLHARNRRGICTLSGFL